LSGFCTVGVLTSLPSTVTRAMLEPSNRTLRAAVNLTPPPSSVRRTEELVPAPTSAALEGAASTSTVGYAEAGSTLSALRAAFFFADAGSAVFGAVGGSGCGGLVTVIHSAVFSVFLFGVAGVGGAGFGVSGFSFRSGLGGCRGGGGGERVLGGDVVQVVGEGHARVQGHAGDLHAGHSGHSLRKHQLLHEVRIVA